MASKVRDREEIERMLEQSALRRVVEERVKGAGPAEFAPARLETGLDITKETKSLLEGMRRQRADQITAWDGLNVLCPALAENVTTFNGGETTTVNRIDDQLKGSPDPKRASPDIALLETSLSDGTKSDIMVHKGSKGPDRIVGEVIGGELLEASNLPSTQILPVWGDGGERTYALEAKAPGETLNELAYTNPEALERHEEKIARQLGEYAAFSVIFGVRGSSRGQYKDAEYRGTEACYLIDPEKGAVTRVDKEMALNMPKDPEKILHPGNPYTQEMGVCEVGNLYRLPAFREDDPAKQQKIMKAFEDGFTKKFKYYRENREAFLSFIEKSRKLGADAQEPGDLQGYERETGEIISAVGRIIDFNPKSVLRRLFEGRDEVKGARRVYEGAA